VALAWGLVMVMIFVHRCIMSPEECRSIREAAGLSRPQLADAIGVGASAIKKYETGLVQISDERGAQITAACGCSDDLGAPFGGPYKPRATNRREPEDTHPSTDQGFSSLISWLLPAGALLALGLFAATLLRDTA
jgi:transcriptional regulator with XRE-family HTH domain